VKRLEKALVEDNLYYDNIFCSINFSTAPPVLPSSRVHGPVRRRRCVKVPPSSSHPSYRALTPHRHPDDVALLPDNGRGEQTLQAQRSRATTSCGGKARGDEETTTGHNTRVYHFRRPPWAVSPGRFQGLPCTKGRRTGVHGCGMDAGGTLTAGSEAREGG
jgi:hypothetical protein